MPFITPIRNHPQMALLLLLVLGAVTWFVLRPVVNGQPAPLPQQALETTQANARHPSLRFVALGDMGSGASFQFDVAQQMLTHHQQQPYTLALVLGDILYPSGEFEKDGDRLYTQVYTPIMKRGVAFKVAIGNHDVVKGFRPGILSFYKMPARYYQFSQGPVDFFALDTNIFDDVKQQQWLDKALGQSTAPWKIVYGHHPIFSSGLHTSSSSLKKQLLPLLQKHNVQLYLAGHDHDYERFAPIGGVTQIVSGGGGAYLRNFLTPEKGSLVRQKRHHFLSVTVTGDTLTLTAIDKTGAVFDTATLTR